jgi:hypothetical protein
MQALTQKQKLGRIFEKFFYAICSSSFKASEGFQVKHNDFNDYASSQGKGVDIRIFKRSRELCAMEVKNLRNFNKPYGRQFVNEEILSRFENSHAQTRILAMTFQNLIPKERIVHGKYVDYIPSEKGKPVFIFEIG